MRKTALIISALMLVAVTLTMAGCGRRSSESEATTVESIDSTATAEPTATGEAAGDDSSGDAGGDADASPGGSASSADIDALEKELDAIDKELGSLSMPDDVFSDAEGALY